MAIKAKNSLGSRFMYIQPVKKSLIAHGTGNSSELGLLNNASFAPSELLVGGNDFLDTGYSYIESHLNEDLEAVLAVRGFSQQRPVLIGAFEYQEPLQSDTVNAADECHNWNPAGGYDYYSTSAGQLIDLQGQLKQLRYSETLVFMTQELTVHLLRAPSGIIHDIQADADLPPGDRYVGGLVLSDTAPGFESQGGDYLKEFDSQVQLADDVLKFLSLLYNTMYTFLRALDIRSLPASRLSVSDDISILYDAIDDDYSNVSKKVSSRSLSDYIVQELDLPDKWYRSAPGTSIILMLIKDVLMKILCPIPGNRYDGVDGWDAPDFTSLANNVTNGELFGIGGQDVYSLVRKIRALVRVRVGRRETTESSDTGFVGADGVDRVGNFSNSGHSNLSNGTWSEGDMINLSSACIDDDWFPTIIYMQERDLAAQFYYKYIGSSVDTPPDKVRANINDVWSAGVSDVFSELSTITSVPPFAASSTNPDYLHRLAFVDARRPPGSPGLILSFDISPRFFPQGVYPGRDGKSYLFDDLLTREMNDVTTSIAIFTQNLSEMKTRLKSLFEGLVMPVNPGSSVDDSSSLENNILEGSGRAAIGTIYLKNLNISMTSFLYKYIQPDLHWTWAGILMIANMCCEHSHLMFKMIKILTAKYGGLMSLADQYASELGDAIYDTYGPTLGDYNPASDGDTREYWEFGGRGGATTFDNSSMRSTELSSHDDWTPPQLTYVLEQMIRRNDTICDISYEAWKTTHASIVGLMGVTCEGTPVDISHEPGFGVTNDWLGVGGPTGGYDPGGAWIPAFLYTLRMIYNHTYMALVPGGRVTSTVEGGYLESDTNISSPAPSTLAWDARAIQSLRQGLHFAHYSSAEYDTWYEENNGQPTEYNPRGQLEGWHVWDGHNGKSNHILLVRDEWKGHIKKIGGYGVSILNSLSFVDSIITNLESSSEALATALSGTDLTSNEFDEVIDRIKTDEEFGNLMYASLTREQLMLNFSLFDSIANTNREYPYLPAKKALMMNQAKNLATFVTDFKWLQTIYSGRKRILPVGITAGLVEYLRDLAIYNTADIAYKTSTVIKIKVWRRNLLDDTEVPSPKEYIFDTSKFIVEGLRDPLTGGAMDASAEYVPGQSKSDLLDKTSVYTYGSSGVESQTVGKAYSFSNTSSGLPNDDKFSKYEDVFINVVDDFYCKLYLMLTSGIDVNEDIFLFLEKEALFTGPDLEMTQTYNELSRQAGERFPTKDLTSAINYDRLIGELRRSILLSPKKWRNRIVYPKIFDRVICLLIDEAEFGDDIQGQRSSLLASIMSNTGDIDWESTREGIQSGEASAALLADVNVPTYYQFFTEITILPDPEILVNGITDY